MLCFQVVIVLRIIASDVAVDSLVKVIAPPSLFLLLLVTQSRKQSFNGGPRYATSVGSNQDGTGVASAYVVE